MHESYPEFLRDLCKIRRQWLSHRLIIGPVVHYAANTLFGHELQILFKQLPANIDLGRQFERLDL